MVTYQNKIYVSLLTTAQLTEFLQRPSFTMHFSSSQTKWPKPSSSYTHEWTLSTIASKLISYSKSSPRITPRPQISPSYLDHSLLYCSLWDTLPCTEKNLCPADNRWLGWVEPDRYDFMQSSLKKGTYSWNFESEWRISDLQNRFPRKIRPVIYPYVDIYIVTLFS
jgi:hypothetical protein